MAFDFKKEYKELYQPKDMPAIVDVPVASVEDYKAAEKWSEYADRIQAAP